MALRPELKRFWPDSGVFAQPDPAYDNMAVLWDQVTCDGGVFKGDVATRGALIAC